MTVITVAPAGAIFTPDEALRLLERIDLTLIRQKLADAVEGKGWDEAKLDLAEGEYRKFLALHLMFPASDIVPCHLVDEIWHAHILDTVAYAEDCMTVFGFFLHHFPYFGMRDAEDAANLVTAYDETVTRYVAAFGEPPAETWRPADAMKCVRKNCRPTKCK